MENPPFTGNLQVLHQFAELGKLPAQHVKLDGQHKHGHPAFYEVFAHCLFTCRQVDHTSSV